MEDKGWAAEVSRRGDSEPALTQNYVAHIEGRFGKPVRSRREFDLKQKLTGASPICNTGSQKALSMSLLRRFNGKGGVKERRAKLF